MERGVVGVVEQRILESDNQIQHDQEGASKQSSFSVVFDKGCHRKEDEDKHQRWSEYSIKDPNIVMISLVGDNCEEQQNH